MTVPSKTRLLEKLRNKPYREAYAEESVRTSLPFQLRFLRDKKEWTQGELARRAGTTQTAISRIEDPEYGSLSLNTLLKMAAAFDVALLVKFVPFSRLLEEFEDLSPEALAAESFEDELPALEEAAVRPASPFAKVRAEDITITYFRVGPALDARSLGIVKGTAGLQEELPAIAKGLPDVFIPAQLGVQDVTTGWPM